MSSSLQKIGVVTATIIGMNAMIGSGIFAVPATLAGYVGPAGIVAYVFVICAVWFMAQSLARLSYLFPQEGSFYTYARQWGGHTIGLIASFAYFVGLLIAMGLLAQMAGSYLHEYMGLSSPFALGIISLIALVIINVLGGTLPEMGQYILICTTVFPLIATTILCLTKTDLRLLTPFAPHGMTNVLKATKVVIFGFFGFECAASLFTIVKDPARNVPRALTYAIVLVGIIYTFFVGSIILSTPLSLFANPRVLIPNVLSYTFPHFKGIIVLIHCSILSAILGTIHSMIWSSSSLLLTLLHKTKTEWLHNYSAPTKHNQRLAVSFVGAAILTSYLTLKNQDLFFSITAMCLVLAFVLSMITLLTLRSEWENKQNIRTIAGLCTASVIFVFAVEGFIKALLH